MSLFLDLLLIAIFVVTIASAYNKGFFRSVMDLASAVASILLAYTVTPVLSGAIYSKYLHRSLSDALASTIASMAKEGVDAASKPVYDLGKLLENEQFGTIVNKYGADMNGIASLIESSADDTYESVVKIADAVADPIATTLSTVIAFAATFIIAFALLKVFTVIVGSFFRLPVLRSMDKGLGLVLGIVTATVTVFAIAMLAEPCLAALSVVAPKMISPHLFENSILLKFFAENNLLSMISNIMA